MKKTFALIVFLMIIMISVTVSAKDIYCTTALSGDMIYDYYVREESVELSQCRYGKLWKITIVQVGGAKYNKNYPPFYSSYSFYRDFNNVQWCNVYHITSGYGGPHFRLTKRGKTLEEEIAWFARGIIALHEHEFK